MFMHNPIRLLRDGFVERSETFSHLRAAGRALA